jgi:hypothetical protein
MGKYHVSKSVCVFYSQEIHKVVVELGLENIVQIITNNGSN